MPRPPRVAHRIERALPSNALSAFRELMHFTLKTLPIIPESTPSATARYAP
jgi:hypothetical protein